MPTKIKDVIPEFVFAGKQGGEIKKWGGLNTTIKDFRTLESGQTYSALNWLSSRDLDHIELRRGQALLGTTRRNIANQHISGLNVGILSNGNQTPFFTYGQSMLYFNGSDTKEVDIANILPALANDEDMNIITYTNVAGSFFYLVSPHSSVYKIAVANPNSVSDQNQSNALNEFKFGWAKIDQQVFQGMNRYGQSPASRDPSGFYLGRVDQGGPYNPITASFGTGNGVTKTFSGNIALPSIVSTLLAVSITDTNELFNDDKAGNLVGSLGGTGTINYVTGAFVVNFNTAPVNGAPLSSTASSEDSTNGGILDFSINAGDATLTHAQIFRQDESGGNAMAAASFQGVEYCFHQLRSWLFQISQTTVNVSSTYVPGRTYQNNPYWSQIGIPYPRAFYETGDGVLYLDNTNQSSPKVSILEIPPGSTNLTVVPVSLSDDLDLSGFAYDKCVVFRWGDLDIMECIKYQNGIKNTYNSVTFVRNIYSGVWNQLDYTFTCLASYLGTLISGDSLSANVFTLFSGFDDDGQAIDNFWNTAYTDLGILGSKKSRYVHLSGLIQPQQKLVVSVSLDFGPYVSLYTILGTGTYVNNSGPVGIGTDTIGSQVLGGGNQVFANPYEIDIPLLSDLYEYISIQVQAIDVGYVSVDNLSLKDNRLKRQRIGQYNDLSISPNV